MGRFEMVLWAADFIITGIGWALGGVTAAIFCFLVGGILVFLALSREDKNPESPPRWKKWHRYGMATFVALVIVLSGIAVVRRVMQQRATVTSPSSTSQAAPASEAKKNDPLQSQPDNTSQVKPIPKAKTPKQVATSAPTSTQPPSQTQTCAPGAQCAQSSGQSGGFTGQVNIGTIPRHLNEEDKRQLVSHLSGFHSKVEFVAALASSDAHAYAVQIQKALRDAGIDAGEPAAISQLASAEVTYGVKIDFRGEPVADGEKVSIPNASQAGILILALDAAHWNPMT